MGARKCPREKKNLVLTFIFATKLQRPPQQKIVKYLRASKERKKRGQES